MEGGRFLIVACKKMKATILTAVLLFFMFPAIIQHVEASEASAKRAPGDFVLVIDPGHGGLDGGATAADGTEESAINLAIALRLRSLCLFLGLPVRMTRTTEALDYPEAAETVREKKVWDQKRRVELINALDNAVLLSVHQNKYPDSRPSGSQVLYAKTAGSAELAALAHANLIAALCPENRRVAAPISEEIYLMREVRCPAILIECGFLSNPEEAALLKSGDYQLRIAAILAASSIQFLAG